MFRSVINDFMLLKVMVFGLINGVFGVMQSQDRADLFQFINGAIYCGF